MSALGHKQTFHDYPPNVRFRGKADVNQGLAEGPLIAKSRHFSTTLRMSAFGGKADIIYGVAKGPLIAISGHCDAVGWELSTAS